jgi:hypothetical protein
MISCQIRTQINAACPHNASTPSSTHDTFGLINLMNDTEPTRVQPKGDELLEMPILRCDRDFPLATLKAFETQAHKLIDGATRGIPGSALKVADTISRRWLVRSGNEHLS